MNVNTRHNPPTSRRQRQSLRWEIRSTAIEQQGRHDPALDGSTNSYGCDGCAAPALTRRRRPPSRARG